jgi:hypothetical protein
MSTARSELLAIVLGELAGAGIKPAVSNARHIKVRFRNANGHQHTITISRSPSHRDARHKACTQVRQLLKQISNNNPHRGWGPTP